MFHHIISWLYNWSCIVQNVNTRIGLIVIRTSPVIVQCFLFLLFDIIGINESKLISYPIHALSQKFDETVINIP